MSAWLLALIAAASITTTYFFCVRPMRSGKARRPAIADATSKDALLRVQIAELREELQILRAEAALEAGRESGRDGRDAAG